MDERVELELELVADGGTDGYRVEVRSAAGDDFGRLRLDPGPLLGARPRLQSTVLASAVVPRGGVSEVEAPVREVGETLFRALFDDRVYAAYKASLALAAERHTHLRVVLRTQSSELAALPWEMMYDPTAGTYLCHREPLVRHVSVSSVTHPLTVDPPLRILGVVSAPQDRQRLDVEDEKQRLRAALAPLGSRVLLHWVEGGRWVDVQQELIADSWHVLHFIGHGGFVSDHQRGVLVLEDDHGGSDFVGAERFSNLLTLQEDALQLVMLNSCSGAQGAAEELFSSTAATLVRTGVSAVVAMQFAVSDPAARAFSAGFYQAIAHNRSVAEAVRVGRIGIQGTGEETLEWITPVVYLRGDDAPLFHVQPGGGKRKAELAPEDAAREAAVQALYQQAMSRFRAREYGDALVLFDALLSDRTDYRDAAERRELAAHEVRVAEAFEEATDAEARGDWAAAVEGYAEVLRLEPDHPRAGARIRQSRQREQVASLQEELRAHANAHDWAAVVAVADELQALSPGDSDPDGLASMARAHVAEAEHRAELERQREEDAERQRLAEEEAARQRREDEEREREEEDRRRREDEERQRREDEEREREEEERRRREDEERQRREDEERRQREREEDERRQREREDEEQRQREREDEEQRQREREEDERRQREREDEERRRRREILLKYVLAPAAALVLGGGGAAIVWSNGDGGSTGNDSVPEPFQSAALYEMARHHFEASECRVPQTEDDAPLAWNLPHTELLRCERPDSSYKGALLCAGDQADYEEARDGFLGEAIGDTTTVPETPAGRSEPWPFQEAYEHVGKGNGRVLWADEDSGCMVELQVEEPGVDAAIEYFLTGLGS